jgi:hypothetical protein
MLSGTFHTSRIQLGVGANNNNYMLVRVIINNQILVVIQPGVFLPAKPPLVWGYRRNQQASTAGD